jgi:hypothetical protein
LGQARVAKQDQQQQTRAQMAHFISSYFIKS